MAFRGSYGNVRPADFLPSDAEILYFFTPKGSDEPINEPNRLVSEDVLSPLSEGSSEDVGDIIGGMYELRLPSDEFTELGTYNIYIRPKEIKLNILDCGFLTGTSIKGVILDSQNSELSNYESLDGFRIEYFENGRKIRNLFRIVTSTNLVEPINSNISSSASQKDITYRLNDSASLFFLTMSPSSSPIDNASLPFIGFPNQEITVTNTFFDAVHIELEVVEDTIETIAAGLYGNQLKNVNNGQYGIFDNDGVLIQGYTLAEIKNDFGESLYEIRTKIDNEDVDLDFNEINDLVKNNN